MILTGETEVLGDKIDLIPLCAPQIPLGLARFFIQVINVPQAPRAPRCGLS
jgi:hypothetical protein